MSRQIDADKLKEDIFIKFGNQLPSGLLDEINNAPTVELDESVIQEVLKPRCMTVVANEYLVALHGKRPQGEWLDIYATHIAYECSNCHMQMPITGYFNFCPNCGADMREADK